MDGAFFDRNTAARAVRLTLPMILPAMESQEAGDSGFLHIVVMNPLMLPGDSDFDEAILYEHSVGDTARWDADYAAYARGKARMSWQGRQNGHVICEVSPHRLRKGEQPLWGGVTVDGVAVGVSGCFPWFDEAFAGAIAFAFIACAKEARFAPSR
ncbi:MAG TPA: hypothetical protein VFM22_10080 [Castellaniella sp.]|jgi:hypothetical protein|nr:hypothetical protein [Castellaniella sp.]